MPPSRKSNLTLPPLSPALLSVYTHHRIAAHLCYAVTYTTIPRDPPDPSHVGPEHIYTGHQNQRNIPSDHRTGDDEYKAIEQRTVCRSIFTGVIAKTVIQARDQHSPIPEDPKSVTVLHD